MNSQKTFRRPALWLLLLILLPLLFPGRSTGAPSTEPPLVLPVPWELVQQWLREGKPLPPFIADPDYFADRGIERPARHAQPLAGSLNALAVLVDFDDEVHTVQAAFFDTLIFAPPVSGTGSVRDYYAEVSYGQVDIVTVNLPSSIDWVRAPSNYTYYTNGSYCMGYYPQNCQKLAEDVVDAVDAVVDFSQYDNDGDGFMEPIMLIHAGQEGLVSGDPWDIWAHAWTLGAPRHYDGVTIRDYIITAEYWRTVDPGQSDMTIGATCHEMGHGFWDLPDLYDYDYSSRGAGRWSLMATGWLNGPNSGNPHLIDGSSPAWMDAWSRVRAGFDTPYKIVGPDPAHTFVPVAGNPGAIARLKSTALESQEYFLIENRQQITGTYDQWLLGSGLFIWHIDDSRSDYGGNDYECRNLPHCSGSCASTHYKVALEQADGQDDLEWNRNLGDDGDPFPGSSGRTFWQPYFQNPGVNPESGSWFDSDCQTDSCIDLTDIACLPGGDCTANIHHASCETEADLGDAPTSANHAAQPMTAYTAAGPRPTVTANFPTVYLPDTPGPRHHFCRADSWLGAAVSGEFDADLGPDEDGPTNISPTLDLADQDNPADEGLRLPLALEPCVSATLAYTVTVGPGAHYRSRYLNAWFDWNRDGDWADVLTCTGGITTTEWAVQDKVSHWSPGVYRRISPPFTPWIAITTGAPLEAWLRLSLAELPAPAPWDGRGPAEGYDYGETEDYFLTLSPTLSISANPTGDPASGDLVTYTVRLDGLGNVAAHGMVVSDVLPLGIEYVASNPPGLYDPAARRITWTAALTPGQPATLTLTVQVSGSMGDAITNPVTLLWANTLWTSATVTLHVGCAPDDPTAAFTWTGPACLSETVYLTSLSTGTLPFTLSWDLDGDGRPDSAAQAPTWQYGTAGEHTVTLTVTNRCGAHVFSDVVTVLAPLTAVEIAGPAALWVGQAGTYTATAIPPGPAAPRFTWDNGTVGVTATYSWGAPGLYSMVVSGSNGCGLVTATWAVSVSDCVALDGLTINGPAALWTGQAGTYLAIPQPPTATNPSYLWSDGSSGSSAVYSWTLPGAYTVSVTATNCLDNMVWDSLAVVVAQEFRIYLPLVEVGRQGAR